MDWGECRFPRVPASALSTKTHFPPGMSCAGFFPYFSLAARSLLAISSLNIGKGGRLAAVITVNGTRAVGEPGASAHGFVPWRAAPPSALLAPPACHGPGAGTSPARPTKQGLGHLPHVLVPGVFQASARNTQV